MGVSGSVVEGFVVVSGAEVAGLDVVDGFVVVAGLVVVVGLVVTGFLVVASSLPSEDPSSESLISIFGVVTEVSSVESSDDKNEISTPIMSQLTRQKIQTIKIVIVTRMFLFKFI